MNIEKLEEAFKIFEEHYHNDVYQIEEREFKDNLANKFKVILSTDYLNKNNFINLLLEELNKKETKKYMVLLLGGKHYEYDNLIEILSIENDKFKLKNIFSEFLNSSITIEKRINQFKNSIENLYKDHNYQGLSKINLNLISQFLGLSKPTEFYIYKSTEFNKAINYFEYKGNLSEIKTLGDKYIYYFGFMKELKKYFTSNGFSSIDFLDLQTFVYRTDWYEPSYENDIKIKFDKEVNKLLKKSIPQLLTKINKSITKPSYLIKVKQHYRDPVITGIVKIDANGICDLCNNYAPFKNEKNVPYLENHHIIYLCEEGEGQFHLNNKTYLYHKEHFFFQTITYENLSEIFTNQ